MDLFVRRQSHQVNQQPTDPSDDIEDADQTEKACRDIYDYRRWEWGNLRVIFTPYIPGVYTHYSLTIQLNPYKMRKLFHTQFLPMVSDYLGFIVHFFLCYFRIRGICYWDYWRYWCCGLLPGDNL